MGLKTKSILAVNAIVIIACVLMGVIGYFRAEEGFAKALEMKAAAEKIIEGDPLVMDRLWLDQNEKELLEHMILQMETERGLDAGAAIADMRFSFIRKVCESSVIKPKESQEYLRSQKLDRILTGKYTGIPAFILIMAAVLGGALALSGFLLQTFFRNPIAGPFVLGISSAFKTICGVREQCMKSFPFQNTFRR